MIFCYLKKIGFLSLSICFCVQFSFAQPTLFKGRVQASHQPVPGASITLLNTGRVAVAGSNGQFEFANLPAGKYVIGISAIGFASYSKEITVAAGGNEPVFELQQSASSLDDVVVTAQKQEERLQKIPSSITALGARQVRDYRLWSNKDITAIVPNLYAADPGDARDVVSVRGISTTSYDPAVVTYIDGVSQFGLDTYIPALYDVERIEVLRGPQGALYGRNAMGGIINIITKKPTGRTNGFAELSAGNYGQQRLSAGFRVPLVSNKLYLGMAGLYDRRSGFYTNEFNNQPYDKQYSGTGNYYLTYLASPAWQFTVNVKHRHNRNKGAFPLVFGAGDALDNPFKLNQNATTTMVDNTLNGSLSISHAGSKLAFSSQTAYQNNYRFYNQPIDGDFSPLDAVSVINDYGRKWNNIKVLTQEFKLSSPAASSSPLTYTAGTYWFYQHAPVKQATRYGNDANLIGAGDSLFSIINTTKSNKWGAAVYGQATYALTQKLRITAGLRYDYENQRQSVMGEYQRDPDPVPMVIVADTSGKVSFSAFSPKLSVDYQLSANSLLYGLYSRGFRTGGLTQLSSDPSQPPLVGFKPEYSSTVEVGIKNTFFANRLRINATVFYSRISNAQVPTLVLPDAITITRNTGKLDSKGVELELSATPLKGLSVDYSFGYTHARFQDLKLSQDGGMVDLAGKKPLFTPDATSMLALQYTYTFGKKQQFQAFARGEWKYIGTTYFDLGNQLSQPSYSLFHARAGLAVKKVELSFWARNLANKKYIAYAYDFGAVHLGDPGVYGATVSVSF